MEEAKRCGHEVDEEVVVVPRPQLGEAEGQDRRQQEERVEDCQAPAEKRKEKMCQSEVRTHAIESTVIRFRVEYLIPTTATAATLTR